jgi:hypothetical protein
MRLRRAVFRWPGLRPWCRVWRRCGLQRWCSTRPWRSMWRRRSLRWWCGTRPWWWMRRRRSMRRWRRLRTASDRFRCVRIQSERAEANLDHAAHAALFPPLRRAAALRRGGLGAILRRSSRRRRVRLVPLVALKCLAQPLQLQDQGLALRADIARPRAVRTVEYVVMGFAMAGHDAAPSSEAVRRTTFGAAAPRCAATCWPAALTRANTSSQRPKAIALPS